VRHGKWKLLIELDGTRAELFDLEADPFERHNLAAAQPHLVAELAEELNRWRQTLPPDLLPPTNQKLTIQ
jgi:arylsulfatase A-like enzyme